MEFSFLTFSEKEPHKYRGHATLVLAVTSLLYGLRLIFPQFVYGYYLISFSFTENATPPQIIMRLIYYHTPIIQGIFLIILSFDMLRTRKILPRHIKWVTLFFLTESVKYLSDFLLELPATSTQLIRVFTAHIGESLLRYSRIITVIASSYLVSKAILLEKKGYTKRLYLSLVAYLSISALTELYLILTPPNNPIIHVHQAIYLVAFLLVAVYCFREYRGVSILKESIENVNWTLRGALFLVGFDLLARWGYRVVYDYEYHIGRVMQYPGYGLLYNLIFIVGTSICIGSLLPWKIVYRDEC